MMSELCEVRLIDAAKDDVRRLHAGNPAAGQRVLAALNALADNAFDGREMADGTPLAAYGLRKIYCDERPDVDRWETTRRLHGYAPIERHLGANLRIVYRLHRKPSGRLIAIVIAIGIGHRNDRAVALYGPVPTVYEHARDRLEQLTVLRSVAAPRPLAA